MQAITQLIGAQSNKSRAYRRDLFLRLMDIQPGMSILDLGGAAGQFMIDIARYLPKDVNVVVADIDPHVETVRQHGFTPALVPQNGPLPFDEHQFDVVLCNSVIEHATILHPDKVSYCTEPNWAARSQRKQAEFAVEIRRIARSYFVQTPHRWSLIEAHFWLPFIGWLPHTAQHALIRHTNRWWVKETYLDFNLLTTGAIRAMFPDAKVHVERWYGLPKSIIAYRRW